MAKQKSVTMTQDELDALIEKKAAAMADSLKSEAQLKSTTVEFGKFNGFDVLRVKGNYGKGGFALGLRKAAVFYTEPFQSQIKAGLKAKGLIKG